MKIYLWSTKILILTVLTFLHNVILAEEDEFRVVAVKKPGTAVRLCPFPIPNAPSGPSENAPEFSLDQFNRANPDFEVDVIFETDIPANGTLFEVNVAVFVKDNAGNPQAVSLLNAIPRSNYARGTSGAILNGSVSLNVRPEFYELPNCEYYFVFEIVDLTYGQQLGARDFSFLTEEALLTKDRPGCEAPLSASCSGAGLSERRGMELGLEELQIFPNPSFDGYSTLSMVLPSENLEKLEIQLFNTQGQLVKSSTQSLERGSRRIQLPLKLSGLPSGLYMLKVRVGNKQFVEKLILE